MSISGFSADRSLGGDVSNGRHILPVRVYFADTDAGGVVYHATYLRYFEMARWEMLALCGADLVVALQRGRGTYVVVEVDLKYRRPAGLGDLLTIVSSVKAIGSSKCVVKQQVMRDGVLLVEGRITLAFVTRGGKPTRQPPAWIEAFRTMMGADAPNE